MCKSTERKRQLPIVLIKIAQKSGAFLHGQDGRDVNAAYSELADAAEVEVDDLIVQNLDKPREIISINQLSPGEQAAATRIPKSFHKAVLAPISSELPKSQAGYFVIFPLIASWFCLFWA